MSQVFVSYRRDVTSRIYDRLAQKYGADDVVMDVDPIPLGADFRAFLGEAVGRCRVPLAVIGPQWLERVQKGFELLLLLGSQALKVPRQIHVAGLRLHLVPADRLVGRER